MKEFKRSNDFSLCIDDYEDMKISGDWNVNSDSKKEILVTITKCTMNCAKEEEIDSFINTIFIKRIAI